MNQYDILQTTKFVIQDLDKLKIEHEKLLQNMIDLLEILPSNQIEEKIHCIKNTMDKIDSDIDQAQKSIELSQNLQCFEYEKNELDTQVKLLSQENTWLRDELGSTQKKLHDSEQRKASCLIELESLKFLKDVKLFDSGYENSTDQALSENQIDLDDESIDEEDLMNDLLPLEDDDDDDDDTNEPGACLDSCENHVENVDRLMISSQPVNDSFISTNGYEIPTRLKAIYNLVIEYTSQGRFEIAIPLCRQALEDLEKTLGYQHPDVATMLNILAHVYRDQSNFKEASSLLYDALAIREKTLGRDHLTVAAILNNLAILNSKHNNLKEAEALCKRAVDVRRKCLGYSHPDVAKQLNNLALICQHQEKYDNVETYYQDAIDIYTENFGANDVNVAKTKNNLASAYLKQRKYFEAEQLHKEIIRCACHMDIKLSRRRSSSSSSSLSSKEHYLYNTIRMNTPIVITTLNNLILLYRRQGQYDIAKILEHYTSQDRYNSQAIIELLDKIT